MILTNKLGNPPEKPIAKQPFSFEKLEQLGQRAKLRRQQLNLTRSEVAERVGIEAYTLTNWERQLPIRPKTRTEILLEEVLHVPYGWLRDPQMETPTPERTKELASVTLQPSHCVADEIYAIGAWLVRASVRKRTSDYNALSPSERRLADIFALRYGVEGEEITTLQSVGDRYGLTRERIRQVVTKMANRASGLQVATPLLDRLAAEIRPYLPASIADLDTALRPLLGESLSVLSTDRFAREILGRGIVFLTDQPADMAAPWNLVAVDIQNHDAELIRTVRDVALRMIRSCGAAQIQFVAGAASGVLNRGITPDEANRACKLITGFEWLTKEDGWFWFGAESENRLLSVTMKVLAVAQRQVDIEDIQNALTRSRRHNYNQQKTKPYMVEPPISALASALRRVNWIKTIQSDDFILKTPTPVQTVLSDAELAIYRVMKARGGIAARHTLKKDLVDTGMVKQVTLHMCLDGSPIVTHLDRGVFALRGARLSPENLATESAVVGGDAIRAQKFESTTADSQGYYTLRFEFTQYMFRHRYWELPTVLSKIMVEGDYQVDGFETPARFSVLPSGSRRLKNFVNKLVKYGLQPGDQALIHIFPERRHIWFEKLDIQTSE